MVARFAALLRRPRIRYTGQGRGPLPEVERLHGVVRDYQEIKSQLSQRTAERDQLVAQYETFRKNLKDMLGQADITLNAIRQPNAPVVATGAVKEAAPIQPIAPAVNEVKQKSGL